MPFTPFHLRPALFFGLLLFGLLNFPTFLIANVIVDLEPLLIMFMDLDFPLHGFFHSFIGGSTVAILLTFSMLKLNDWISKIMPFFKLKQKTSPRSVWLSSFSGIYFHILLDSRLYTDIKPFYPFNYNPFYSSSILVSFEIYTFCILCFFAGFLLCAYKIIRTKRI